MSETRPKLSLRKPDPQEAADLIREAIEHQVTASAIYNRTRIVFAPHALYTRHGDHHVDAVVVERDGQAPREQKVGTYRLSGLKALKLTAMTFEASEAFDRDASQYSGEGSIVVGSK